MRATKLIKNIAHLTYEQRLKKLKLPTLKYRRLRGEVIDVYKIISGIYDAHSSLKLNKCTLAHTITRGNTLRLVKTHCKYDLRKYFFSNRIILTWNSLPDYVVLANSLNLFKNRLDGHWSIQDVLYNWEADLTVTGDRSKCT